MEVSMLDQSIVNAYLRCPECRSEESLKYNRDRMICKNCGFEPKVRFGIPALINKEEIGIYNYNFFNIPADKRKNKSPYKKWTLNFFQRNFLREIVHFFTAIFFLYKFGLKKITLQRYCKEVEKALYYGWKNYYNLIKKSGEGFHFNQMKKYIIEPSLEFGCATSRSTNMAFRDSVGSITFGCEYFLDNFMNDKGELNDEMYKVIKHYVGGSIMSLPFRTDVFASVIMGHVIDHIVNIDGCLKEINRILRPKGHLIMTANSKNIFEHLPGVKLRKIFSQKWSERYKERRIVKDNPRGNPMKSDFEYDAVGQNLFSIEEWMDTAKTYGFEVIDYAFFGKYFSYFWDIEIKGYGNSILFNQFIYAAISEIIEREKRNPLSEEESTLIILVLKKQKSC